MRRSILWVLALAVAAGCGRAEADEELDEHGIVEDNSSAPLQCFLAAQDQTLLGDEQARRLCLFSPSPTGPVECYEYADDELFLSQSQQIELCRCAQSAAPAQCFDRAKDETFLSDGEVMQLCAPVFARALQPNCRPAY